MILSDNRSLCIRYRAFFNTELPTEQSTHSALEWAGTEDTDTFDDDKDSIELFQNQSVITNLSSTINH